MARLGEPGQAGQNPGTQPDPGKAEYAGGQPDPDTAERAGGLARLPRRRGCVALPAAGFVGGAGVILVEAGLCCRAAVLGGFRLASCWGFVAVLGFGYVAQ